MLLTFSTVPASISRGLSLCQPRPVSESCTAQPGRSAAPAAVLLSLAGRPLCVVRSESVWLEEKWPGRLWPQAQTDGTWMMKSGPDMIELHSHLRVHRYQIVYLLDQAAVPVLAQHSSQLREHHAVAPGIVQRRGPRAVFAVAHCR